MEDNFEGINTFFTWKRFVWHEIEKKKHLDNVIQLPVWPWPLD